MRVLFLDAYFEPEQIAFTHLENDLLEGMIQEGHEIEIICPTPTRGVRSEVIKEYKKRKSETLYDGHVHVTRFFAPQEGKNPIIRAIRYFWCNFRTYQISKKLKSIEAVFAYSTPPTQGWVAGQVAKKHKVPFVYSLQDIFPDSLVTTGMTQKGSVLWKIGRMIENSTYKHCARIIVISESMKENLLQKGVSEDLISCISNWIDLEATQPIPRENNSLFDELGIKRDKFIVLYAGNFGAAQGAEIVLDAAEKLQDNPNIQFVIFGGGAGFTSAEARSKTMGNVIIHPLLPQDRISEVYSMGDVALVTCKKGVGKSGMPSKVWSIMACNTPIIASFDLDSELSSIIYQSKAGYVVNPEDCNELVRTILIALECDNKRIQARDYVEKKASKAICVKQYINCFDLRGDSYE